jgi:hypothetical protein
MNPAMSGYVIDRCGVRGAIEGTLPPGTREDERVLVCFRDFHRVAVPVAALVRTRPTVAGEAYYLPLSLVELERHQHALFPRDERGNPFDERERASGGIPRTPFAVNYKPK